jgi:hypothetical protein
MVFIIQLKKFHIHFLPEKKRCMILGGGRVEWGVCTLLIYVKNKLYTQTLFQWKFLTTNISLFDGYIIGKIYILFPKDISKTINLHMNTRKETQERCT